MSLLIGSTRGSKLYSNSILVFSEGTKETLDLVDDVSDTFT